MQKKSVLMVVAKYPATHGHTTVINNLCIGLRKLGYDTAIGAFAFYNEPPANIKKVRLSRFRLLKSGVNYLDYDIIHSHQAQVNYFLLSVNPKKPVIFHYHGASNKIQQINFKIMMLLYKKKISKIISVSHAGIKQMESLIGTINADVIYNGVDVDFYKPSLEVTFKKGEPQLIFVSALRKYKNTIFLIKSMPEILKKFPDAHLQIIGEGEDFINLKEFVEKNNINKKVELTGKVNDEELKLRYSSSDLYVSASLFEVCPVPTLEAMSSGKPLALCDIEPHKEIIETSKAGEIFSLSDNVDIVSKIDQVYKNRYEYGRAARKFAESISWESICKQLDSLYQNIP
jgi:glycosyltransferase involved in cell wall biosynthesis